LAAWSAPSGGSDDSEWEDEHWGCPLVEMEGVPVVSVILEGLQYAFDEESL
jgi:hypothetical protein